MPHADMDRTASKLPDSRQLTRSWVDGKAWGRSDGTLTSVDPFDGSAFGETELASIESVDAAVKSSRAGFEGGWGRLSAADRKRLILDFADKVAENVEHLAGLEAAEVGRPIADARQIILASADLLRKYAWKIERITGDLATVDDHNLAMVWRRPRGVVAAIVSWNFPVLNVVLRLGPALAAGNAVVVKCSEHAPRSAILLAQLASEAGLPDGAFNLLHGEGRSIGRALVAHRDVDLVAFTGSTAVGREVATSACALSMRPVLLECGGKSPQILLEDIFDDPGIWGPIFWNSFWNSGQWCATRSRLLVPRNTVDATLQGLSESAKTWVLGDPKSESTGLGPLVNRAQLNRVNGYFESATVDGEVVDLGCPHGELPEKGCFSHPAVAVGLPRGHAVTREEVFGPLLSLETYDSIEDAIRLADASDYGLAANVWTRRMDLGYRLIRNLRAGVVSICSSSSGMKHFIPELSSGISFEPQKQSGVGIDAGLQGILAYTTAHAVNVIN